MKVKTPSPSYSMCLFLIKVFGDFSRHQRKYMRDVKKKWMLCLTIYLVPVCINL